MSLTRIVIVSFLCAFVVGCTTDSESKRDETPTAQAQQVDKSDQKTSNQQQKESGFDKEKLKKCVEKCLEQRQQQSKPYPQIRSACEQECSGIRD
jgi:cytochrome c556